MMFAQEKQLLEQCPIEMRKLLELDMIMRFKSIMGFSYDEEQKQYNEEEARIDMENEERKRKMHNEHMEQKQYLFNLREEIFNIEEVQEQEQVQVQEQEVKILTKEMIETYLREEAKNDKGKLYPEKTMNLYITATFKHSLTYFNFEDENVYFFFTYFEFFFRI